MGRYFTALGASLADPWRHRILFWTIILQYLALLLAFIPFAFLTFLLASFLLNLPLSTSTLNALPAALLQPASLILPLLFLIGGTLLLTLLWSWFQVGLLGLINKVIEGARPSKQDFFTSAATYTTTYFRFTIIKFLLGLPPLLLFLIPLLLLFLNPAPGKVILFFGALILAGILSLLLEVWLLFGEPLIVRRGENVRGTLRESWRLLRRKTGHTIISFLMIFLLSIALGIGNTLLTSPFYHLAGLLRGAASTILIIIAQLLSILISLFLVLALYLLLFRLYKEGCEEATPAPPSSPSSPRESTGPSEGVAAAPRS